MDRNKRIKVSECERPVSRGGILSFSDKYEGGKRVFPADIEKSLSQKIKRLTAKIYQKLMLTGVIRIDYFIYKGNIFVNEINTVPGSLAYYLFGNTLKTLTEILSEVIERASIDYAKSQTYQTEYVSGKTPSIGVFKSSNISLGERHSPDKSKSPRSIFTTTESPFS